MRRIFGELNEAASDWTNVDGRYHRKYRDGYRGVAYRASSGYYHAKMFDKHGDLAKIVVSIVSAKTVMAALDTVGEYLGT